MHVLDYEVVDAKYSNALSRIVIASDAPTNALHLVDPVSGTDQVIDLPATPVAVAVKDAGPEAAVAYDAHVSFVDLTAGTVTKTCDISSDAYDIALSSTHVAYVVPRTDQWVSLHIVDSSACAESLSTGIGALWAASHVALHPSEKAVFAADQGLSPSRIDRCEVDATPVECADSQGQADWGTYGYCGNLWASADGLRIYSACGVTLKVPGNIGVDPLTYGGKLDGATLIEHLSEAPSAGRVAFIPAVSSTCQYDPSCDQNADAVVRVNETAFLGFVNEYPIPKFPAGGGSLAVGHGRFVFTTPAMDSLFVVLQADPSAGALHDFGIATLTP